MNIIIPMTEEEEADFAAVWFDPEKHAQAEAMVGSQQLEEMASMVAQSIECRRQLAVLAEIGRN